MHGEGEDGRVANGALVIQKVCEDGGQLDRAFKSAQSVSLWRGGS